MRHGIARGDQIGKIPIIGQENDQQDGNDHHHVDRNGNQRLLARSDKKRGEWSQHADANGEGGRPHMHQAEHAANGGDAHVEGDLRLQIGIAIGEQAEAPAGEAQRQRCTHKDHRAQIGPRLGDAQNALARPQPHIGAHYAEKDQGGGQVDGECHRGDRVMGPGHDDRVRHQHRVHQRNLPAQGTPLRHGQVRRIGRLGKNLSDALECGHGTGPPFREAIRANPNLVEKTFSERAVSARFRQWRRGALGPLGDRGGLSAKCVVTLH